ncbi:MAG: PIN domain nuclease [Actinomycetota bacterium]
MALRYLVDTSVLKRLGRVEVRKVVEPLAVSGQLGRARICDLEIGFSARNADEWDQLVGALDAFDAVEITALHLRRALQVQRLLAERSQRGRKIPDLLIAAAAEEHDIAVLHYDADFDMIASITGQRCQWVVPAGTVE